VKKIYWRPREISRTVLLLISVFSLIGFIGVEHFQIKTRQDHYEEKMRAAHLAQRAMEVIREERHDRNMDIDTESDPAQSGLIGSMMTPVTSDPGYLPAKQTSINPNFAAVIVEWLEAVGAKKGDAVAVGMSGSFPALNIAVYAALETLELKPIIISSAAASQWGANDPELLWIDMERILCDPGNAVFHTRSVAASIGGTEDRGVGMPEEGIEMLMKAIKRNDLPLVQPKKTAKESIDERIGLYRRFAGPRTIRAYINVGGGTLSVGTRVGKALFAPGLNRRPPVGAGKVDSVMTRFIGEGVPVIHLVHIDKLAQRYGLPVQPRTSPVVGEGKIFYREEYNHWLAAGVLAVILGSLYAFIRSEWGFRIVHSSARKKGGTHLEPMI
jgi:poly-gamma-glutamate system protein